MSPIPIPTNAVRVESIGGVKLFYERGAIDDTWGDLAPSEAMKPFMLPLMYETLDVAFNYLWNEFLPKPDGIISAGAWVDKPGAHGLGIGFDLDGMVWEGNQIYPKRRWNAVNYSTPAERAFYIALNAHFLLYFGNVLSRFYNVAHLDHFHLDKLIKHGFRSNSVAQVGFVQAALTEVLQIPTFPHDGIWGKITRDNFFKFVNNIATGMYPTEPEWNMFLVTVRKIGFEKSGFGLVKPKEPETIIESSVDKRITELDIRMTKIEQSLSRVNLLLPKDSII